MGWLAGVARVDPVDVPVWLKREGEANLQSSAGRYVGRLRDKRHGKVLRLHWTRAAVTINLELRVRGRRK
jgi:hypothetical protein